jgi:phosphoribosylglycinamide formyltransferase-1
MMASARIVVLISGQGSNLQAIINACKNGQLNGNIAAVISNQVNAYGLVRSAQAGIDTQVLTASNFANRADYDAALAELIDSYQADLIVMAGFMRILTPEFVQRFEGKMLNIHPSLLPRHQGLHTHQRALDNGDEEHGCSVHFVTAELDGGPIILQARVPVFSDDTADILAQRVHVQEHQIYPMVIQWFCQGRLSMNNDQAWLDAHPLPANGYAAD